MLLKFNNIRDLSDARYAAAAMAEWVGFTVGQEDSHSAAKIQEILGWCSGPKLVLEMGKHIDIKALNAFLAVLPVSAVETDMDGYLYLKQFPGLEKMDFILNSGKYDGVISHSSEFEEGRHIVNVSNMLTSTKEITDKNPFGISLDCQKSEYPALKNFDDFTRFFEELGIF